VFTPMAFKLTPVFRKEIENFEFISRKNAESMLGSVKEIPAMLDRTKTTPVVTYILSTLAEGLPSIRQQNKQINDDTIFALNYIFYHASKEKDSSKQQSVLKEIAHAYQGCQAVQQQTIMNIFARLSNVELNFESQVLQTLGQYKLRILDKIVVLLNSNANGMTDKTPSSQGPHIRNGYLLAIERRTGIALDGHDAALSDQNRPKLTSPQKESVASKYLELFSAEDFIAEFAADINQTVAASVVAHNYDSTKFFQWVTKLGDEKKFDAHSIFYDSDKSTEYERPQVDADIGLKPYLSLKVARNVLQVFGLIS